MILIFMSTSIAISRVGGLVTVEREREREREDCSGVTRRYGCATYNRR
jgi:hypothetical protein